MQEYNEEENMDYDSNGDLPEDDDDEEEEEEEEEEDSEHDESNDEFPSVTSSLAPKSKVQAPPPVIPNKRLCPRYAIY